MWVARARAQGLVAGPAVSAQLRRLSSKFTIHTPFLSDSVPLADGVLGVIEEIRVQPGDKVKEGTVVMVVDTHKAALEVRSPKPGLVRSVLVKVGDEIQEKKPIIECDGP